MSWLNDMSYEVKLHHPQNQCAILKKEKPKIAKNLLLKSILEAVRIFFQLLCFQEKKYNKKILPNNSLQWKFLYFDKYDNTATKLPPQHKFENGQTKIIIFISYRLLSYVSCILFFI